MRATLAAVLIAAALTLGVPAPAQAQSQPIQLDATAQSAVAVDLISHAAKAVRFTMDEQEFATGALDSVSVRLQRAGEPTMELALQRSGSLWSASLPVATPDLITGAWTVAFTAVKEGGSGEIARVPLQVTAADTAAPKLSLAIPAASIILGPTDSVALNVSDPLLRSVTYTFGGLPAGLPLAFPYLLRGDLLPQGQTTVVFQALDRAGHSATLAVPVDRDAILPRIDLQVPAHAYVGAPLTFLSLVREDGPHTLRLLSNGSIVSEVKVPGFASPETNRTHAFTVSASEPGNASLQVEVIDRAGNRAQVAREMVLEPPIVDAKAGSLRLGTSGPLYVKDPVKLNATVLQVGGVATLPLTVVFEAAGRSMTLVTDVAKEESKTVGWSVNLSAGTHTAKVSVAAPTTANETAPGNENATLTFEVFLGRLAVDGKRFDIRAAGNGLPSSAVESGSTKSYPMKIVDRGAGIAYEFTTSANQTYVWDPLKPMDDRDTNATASESSSETDAARGAPAPGVATALLVVALAALSQRRKA
ncbi:MAG: hypothetical protein ACYC2H_05975 [Thermoplasmatota archaeon]